MAPEGKELPAVGQAQQGVACWSPCPGDVSAYRGQNGLEISCYCSAGSTALGSVYGTGYYTDDSALCRAALHSGAIPSTGGNIVATIEPGQSSYTSSSQNGVYSYYWGAYYGSVSIAAGETCIPECPTDVTAFRGQNGTQVVCSCPSSATTWGSIWGTNTYTDDSKLCRAAVHAGAITTSGGTISATIRPGQSSYVGSTQNGVTSSSYTFWSGSVEISCY